MANKKEVTKELLAMGLKELMAHTSFEKITIKMITDAAGVIRPTFYNHFQDKYEVLDYIFREEVLKKVYPILEAGMDREAGGLLFRLVSQDITFYKKAFSVTGQNSFTDMVKDALYESILQAFRNHKMNPIPGLESLQKEKIGSKGWAGTQPEDDMASVMFAQYYAISLANILEQWVLRAENRISPEQMETVYYYLVTHSLFDMLKR